MPSLIPHFDESDKHPGQLDLSQYIDLLDHFQADAIDYLYDVEPQSQNLFWAGYFNEASEGTKEEKAFYNASYRIRKISIPMPKLEVDQNNVLRAPIFKNANFSQEVTIDWFEDVYHSVKKYHLDWYARWYNRQFDVLRCGVAGKFRKLIVVAYHYVNSNDNSLIETPVAQPIMAFHIGGLIPLEIPDMNFDYSSDQNDTPVTIRYKCGRIQWAYSDQIGIGTKADIWGDATNGMKGLTEIKTWNPNGYQQDGIPKEASSQLEQLRVARAATSFQVSEGMIG